jgi:hypothetical protein
MSTTTTTTDERATDTDTTVEQPVAAPPTDHVEDRRDRVALARDAGWRRISFASVLAGVFVAYGAFAILIGIVSAVLDAVGVDTKSLSDADWRNIGAGSAAALFLVLLLTYFYGGYVAGRMARRSGFMHGVLVFVFGVLLLVLAAGLVYVLDGTDAIRDQLRDLGAPTSSDKWIDIGSAAGIAGALAMLIGAAFGGMRGERWHQRLIERAADPTYGPEAVARAQAAREAQRNADQERQAEQRTAASAQPSEATTDDDASRGNTSNGDAAKDEVPKDEASKVQWSHSTQTSAPVVEPERSDEQQGESADDDGDRPGRLSRLFRRERQHQ